MDIFTVYQFSFVPLDGCPAHFVIVNVHARSVWTSLRVFMPRRKNKTAYHTRYRGCSGRSPNGTSLKKEEQQLIRDKERNDKEIEATTKLFNAAKLIIVCQQ